MKTDTLLSELLRMIADGDVRLQPNTLIDAERPAIEAQIKDWLGRASFEEGIQVNV